MFWITASGSQLTLLPILASQRLEVSPGGLGGIFAIIAAINVLGSQPAAWLSDKVYSEKAVRRFRDICISCGLVKSASPIHRLIALYRSTLEEIYGIAVWD